MKDRAKLVLYRRFLKSKFPRAYFTKTGPGILHEARRAFRKLDPMDRIAVIALGWVSPQRASEWGLR